MQTGKPLADVVGSKAEIVGNPGALMDMVKQSLGAFAELTVIGGMDTKVGVRAGMSLEAAIGPQAEVVARADSPLLKAVSGLSLKTIETLSPPQEAPRRAPQGPKSGM